MYIPEGTTNTSVPQKENYKAYAVSPLKRIKREKKGPKQQMQRNHSAPTYKYTFKRRVFSVMPLSMA